MRTGILAMLLLAPSGAYAQRPEVPLLSDAEIRAALTDGEEIEGRVDGDLNADGDMDTAYIVRSDETRMLHVQFAAHSELELYHQPAGRLELDAYPLGPADLTIAKGVLVVKDLTGGTTATAVTYRFRGDTAQPRMRLIGLDATTYSRTYAHDGSEMSWNVLTGAVIATALKLVGSGEDATYDKTAVKRFKRPVKAYFMEDTPGAEETLGMAMQSK